MSASNRHSSRCARVLGHLRGKGGYVLRRRVARSSSLEVRQRSRLRYCLRVVPHVTVWTRRSQRGGDTLPYGAGCGPGERLHGRLGMGPGRGEEAGALVGRQVLPAAGIDERDIAGVGHGRGVRAGAPECYVSHGESDLAADFPCVLRASVAGDRGRSGPSMCPEMFPNANSGSSSPRERSHAAVPVPYRAPAMRRVAMTAVRCRRLMIRRPRCRPRNAERDHGRRSAGRASALR